MKYRHLYENAIGVMATTRISYGMILKMNEMALQLFGYSAQEEIMEARSIDEFYVDPEERTRFLKELNERGSLHNHELKFRRKDGTILWVELAAKILVKEGKIDSVFTDISKRKIAEENVHKLTFYDPLTDLPNKQLFRDRLGIAIIKSQRKSKDAIFAVMCVGIDRFKNINDMHGTAAGDMLLKAIAKRLLATFREDDVVSRFDGDKFMTLFSDIASTDDIIDVVRKTFASFENPFLIADEEMYITASLGVCVYPNDGENAEQLINNSESAMYASKERGRGTYQLFDAELNEGLLSRIKMETDLKNAIMEKELETYFQPKVSQYATIQGMESLLRWHSQARGPVSPSQFIGIAEKNGMFVDIGNLVFRESCRLTKKWLDQGFPPLRVSVNISPYQFREDYISTIQAILKDTGLDPGLLEIEITESGIMENEEENIRKLHQLHALGVSISIDDFGTGYSSLSKLKEYPIDTLKIDKSFIDELPHNDKSVTLARTIIDMAHNLGFRVVAEGIERAEQLEFLKNAECDMYQGYYFSRAIPAGEFEERLRVMFGEKA
jgi:diguanylate cyclase (GGDEF)-like protein/PAS domain S-box-containing protein